MADPYELMTEETLQAEARRARGDGRSESAAAGGRWVPQEVVGRVMSRGSAGPGPEQVKVVQAKATRIAKAIEEARKALHELDRMIEAEDKSSTVVTPKGRFEIQDAAFKLFGLKLTADRVAEDYPRTRAS